MRLSVTICGRLILMVVFFLGTAAEVMATILEPALLVQGPGQVLFVDGPDKRQHVRTFNLDLTFPLTRLELGFVEHTGFTGIAIQPMWDVSLFGTHTFSGGQLVDFALRDRVSGSIFSMSDSRNFATQYYFSEVHPSHAQNPVTASPYYNALVI